MADAIGELRAIISANASAFTEGLVLSRKELREAAKVMEQTRTPAERYSAQVDKLNALARKGALDAETHRRAIKQAADAYRESETAAKGASASVGSLMASMAKSASTFAQSYATNKVKNGYDEIMRFQQAMANSTAIAGDLSAESMTKMEQHAQRIAFQTKFTATEAAQGYEFLISSGLDAAQAVAASGVSAKFAQAGSMDLAASVRYLTDAQGALGIKSKDAAENMRQMQRVGDVLTKGNILSTASVEEMSRALTTKAAAAARNAGKELEEVAAVLAVMAEQGMKGETGGTNFAIMLRDLQTKALEFKKEFKAAGIEVFVQSGKMKGSVHNLADIIGQLEKRLGSMTPEMRKAELNILGFNDKSVASIMSLIGFSEKIRENEAAMHKAGGTIDEVASKKMPALAQAFHRSQVVLDAFFQQSFSPTMDAFGKASTQQLPAMAKAFAFLLDVADAGEFGMQAWKTFFANIEALADETFYAVAQSGLTFHNRMRALVGMESIRPKWMDDLGASAQKLGKEADAANKKWEAFNNQVTRGDKFRTQLQNMATPLDTTAAGGAGSGAKLFGVGAGVDAEDGSVPGLDARATAAAEELRMKLQEQVMLHGKAAREAQILKLAQEGAADAVMRQVKDLDAQLTKLEAMAKFNPADKSAGGAIRRFDEAQSDLINLNLPQEQFERQFHELQESFEKSFGIDSAETAARRYMDHVKDLQEILSQGKAGWQDIADATEDARRKMLGLESDPFQEREKELRRIREFDSQGRYLPGEKDEAIKKANDKLKKSLGLADVEDPIEKAKKKMADLERLKGLGLKTDDQFKKEATAIAKEAKDSAEKDGGRQKDSAPAFAGAAVAGSQEAFSAVLAALRERQGGIQQKQLAETQKMSAYLEKLAREKGIVVIDNFGEGNA